MHWGGLPRLPHLRCNYPGDLPCLGKGASVRQWVMDIGIIDVTGATVGEHCNKFRACCPLEFFGKQPEVVCGNHVTRRTDIVQGVIGEDGYRLTIDRFDEKRSDVWMQWVQRFLRCRDCYTPDSSSLCRPSCETAD